MTSTTPPAVDDKAAALRREAGELDLGPEGARIFLAVLKDLAHGVPLAWFGPKDIEPVILSPAEGFEPGERWFEKVHCENR